MAVLANTIETTDVAPAISIDLVNNLEKNIGSLMELLGVTDLQPIAEGNTIKVYSTSVGTIPAQVAEGDEIPLTEVKLVEGTPFTMTLKKYRKLVTAEAIQKVGRERAIYNTDRALIGAIRGDIKSDFFTALGTGSGTAEAGTNLQSQLAQNWGAMQTFFKDYGDVNPVHFVNPLDVADYLGAHQITVEERFGFRYVEDFMGLGTVIFAPEVTEKTVISTAQENLRGYYVPANGSVGQEFELETDETGMVGITHGRVLERASIQSLIMTGVRFFPEVAGGVITGTFGA